MKSSESLVNDWALEAFAIEKVKSFQQDILQSPDEAQNTSQALLQAYGKLTEQEKMAFILAGESHPCFNVSGTASNT